MKRSDAARTTATAGSMPDVRSSFMRATSITAFVTFIPMSPNSPSNEKKSNSLPLNNNPATTPINIRGMVSKIISVSRYELNSNNSMTKISNSVSGRYFASA